MRVNTMKKLLEKIENVEKETNSEATIDGYLEGFIINLYKHGQPLARSIFNEKWVGDDFMNELVRFETNALHNAEKLERREMSEEEKQAGNGVTVNVVYEIAKRMEEKDTVISPKNMECLKRKGETRDEGK